MPEIIHFVYDYEAKIVADNKNFRANFLAKSIFNEKEKDANELKIKKKKL